MKYLIAFLFLLTCYFNSGAQEFGGNRFSTKWRQLNTDTARIISPRGLDSSAARVAEVVHSIAGKNRLALGEKLKKIDIVLQPQTVISNGYVGLGPYRSEFYMTPPADNFDMGSIPWADQLALHEYRHVQQYNNFYNGASKVMRYLFGEEGYALAIHASIPDWFFEGDAVYQETALSQQGRGRLPSFLKAYPALWQAGKNYSWMQLRNGSYKDYVPNHYDLGYLLVNYGYEKYGNDFWKKVTNDASAFIGLLYPMQKAVKKYSGLKYNDFTKQALKHYKEMYQKTSGFEVPGSGAHQSTSNIVTNYYFSQQISADSLLYLKTSYTERPAFYIKDGNGEHRLRIRDISIDEQFSYKNGKIVYSALENDPRWQWTNYSIIKILNIQTNEQKTLRTNTKYFSPDISEDGKTIIANNVLPNGKSSLVLLKSDDGNIIQEFSADSISYFGNPKFLAPRKIVAAVRLQNSKSFIGLIDLNANSVAAITPPAFNTVGYVSVLRNLVYFSASQGLKDEIFSVDIQTKQLKKLSTDQLTNYFPNAGFGKINYSYFTALGYKLSQQSEKDAIWQNVNITDFINTPSGIFSANQQHEGVFTDSIATRKMISKSYAKLTNPFNFHSWRPNYDDPIFDFTVYGNNILNTVETQLQYQYNQNDRTHAVGGALVYGGLFPFISVGSKYTLDRSRNISNKLKEWNEWNNYVGVSIPLSWAGNRTYKFFNWGATYSNRTDFNKGIYRDTFRTVRFGYLLHQLSWAQQIAKARLDIFPMWGYNISAQFRHALNMYNGWQFYSKANLFLPGIFANHSFYVTGAFQEATVEDRIFSNRFPFARGFHAADSARLAGLTFNYHFPVAYPDWGFANIFYLMRLRTNVFYDYTKIIGKTAAYKKELMSAGAELFFDTKWWNQHSISFGVRGGYQFTPDPVTKEKKPFFEFILPVSLIPR